MHRILIDLTDRSTADLVRGSLEGAGYEVFESNKLTEVVNSPHLVVLDLEPSSEIAFSNLRNLRLDPRLRNIPFIVVGSSSDSLERIKGFEAGADEYLTIPIKPREMVLRVQALLRRSSGLGTENADFGPIRFGEHLFEVYLNGLTIELTAVEFKLLRFLCQRPGAPQVRKELLRCVWGHEDELVSRTLDTHVKRLRRKLGAAGSIVKTVRGVGYCVTTSEMINQATPSGGAP